MSKEVDWGIIHGAGEIVCECDQCDEEHRVAFEDGPDFKEAQNEIESIGWQSARINGEWFDFCCATCRNKYISKNL